MTKYFFKVTTRDIIYDDEYGEMVVSDDDACLEAQRIACRLVEEEDILQRENSFSVSVRNERGESICQIEIISKRTIENQD